MEHNMNREEYLQHKVEPYDPSKINSVEEALTALEACSFQGRNLGVASSFNQHDSSTQLFTSIDDEWGSDSSRNGRNNMPSHRA